ncbi:hypothetical protein DL98DRAFT_593403 [Cadophora sp. DSE1049]|nr:hypothetical protein DL98DRAFT_593403 [Cadophora sp. DSE1049]
MATSDQISTTSFDGDSPLDWDAEFEVLIKASGQISEAGSGAESRLTIDEAHAARTAADIESQNSPEVTEHQTLAGDVEEWPRDNALCHFLIRRYRPKDKMSFSMHANLKCGILNFLNSKAPVKPPSRQTAHGDRHGFYYVATVKTSPNKFVRLMIERMSRLAEWMLDDCFMDS